VTALGTLQASLCIAVVATAGLLGPIANHQLRRHIRREHPRVWRRFGFTSVSFFSVPWKEEHEALIAEIGFKEFFSTGQFKTLNDPRLNALWRRVKTIGRAGMLALALLVLNCIVFRAAPDFSWLFGGR
jgi:hypothetical protein